MFVIGMLVFLCIGCIILGAWQMHHSKKLNRIISALPKYNGPAAQTIGQ